MPHRMDEIKTEHYLVFNPDGSYNEQSHNLRHHFKFRNLSNLLLSFGGTGLNLLYPIDFTGETPIPTGQYNNVGTTILYESDPRKPLSFNIGGGYRGFYNGTLTNYAATLAYSYQPWFSLSLKYEQNNIQFPDPYGSAKLNLFNSRIEVNFSKSLFWTTFLQYNAQSEDFGVNSRLQWRFAPLSDIYLVYTDNYLAPVEQQMGISHKNRSVVLKFSYWWNV